MSSKPKPKPEPIDILWMELSQELPYWLSPEERYKHLRDEIRKRNRDKYLAKKKAAKNAPE